MAAPVLESSSSNEGNSTTNVTVCKPACTVAGDLLWVFQTSCNLLFSFGTDLCVKDEFGYISWNTGSSAADIFSLAKIAGCCEPCSYSFRRRSGGSYTIHMLRISGSGIDLDGCLGCDDLFFIGPNTNSCGFDIDPCPVCLTACCDDYLAIVAVTGTPTFNKVFCVCCCPEVAPCDYTKESAEWRNTTFDYGSYIYSKELTCATCCEDPGVFTLNDPCGTPQRGNALAIRTVCASKCFNGTPCNPPVLAGFGKVPEDTVNNSLCCFVMPMPSCVVAGDLLITIINRCVFGGCWNWGCGENCEGWTQLWRRTGGTRQELLWKRANGTESGTNLTMNVCTVDSFHAWTMRITGVCSYSVPNFGCAVGGAAFIVPNALAIIDGIPCCTSNLFIATYAQPTPNVTVCSLAGPAGFLKETQENGGGGTGSSFRISVACKAYVRDRSLPRSWITDNNVGSVTFTLGLTPEGTCGCKRKSPKVRTTAASNQGASACTTCFAVVAPSGIKNRDLIIIALSRCDCSGAITCVPAGFAVLKSYDAVCGSTPDVDIYWKEAGPSEPACYCFVSATCDAWAGIAYRIDKANTCEAPLVSACVLEVCSAALWHPFPTVFNACFVVSNYLAIDILALSNSVTGVTFDRTGYVNSVNATKTCIPITAVWGGHRSLTCVYRHRPGLAAVNGGAVSSSTSILVAPRGQRVKNVCTEETCCTNSLTFTIPCDVIEDDLLFIMIQRCVCAGGLTWPAGWCSFFSEDTANSDLDLAWHVVLSACEACCSVVVNFCTCDVATGHQYHMRNVFIDGPPKVSCSAVTGTSATPDPPCLTAPRDSYIAVTFVGGQGDITEPACCYPACHTAGATVEAAGACFNWSLSSYSTIPFNDTSSNPGPYTINTSRDWAAITLFVQPLPCGLQPAINNIGGWMSIIGKPGGV